MVANMSISVDVVSDVVCPWCFIGQKRLDRALESLPDIDVTVSWTENGRAKSHALKTYAYTSSP